MWWRGPLPGRVAGPARDAKRESAAARGRSQWAFRVRSRGAKPGGGPDGTDGGARQNKKATAPRQCPCAARAASLRAGAPWAARGAQRGARRVGPAPPPGCARVPLQAGPGGTWADRSDESGSGATRVRRKRWSPGRVWFRVDSRFHKKKRTSTRSTKCNLFAKKFQRRM